MLIIMIDSNKVLVLKHKPWSLLPGRSHSQKWKKELLLILAFYSEKDQISDLYFSEKVFMKYDNLQKCRPGRHGCEVYHNRGYWSILIIKSF